jgi:hypothetical protein
MDHDSITLLWISVVSEDLAVPSGLVARMGKYGLGQLRGSSTPR